MLNSYLHTCGEIDKLKQEKQEMRYLGTTFSVPNFM